MAHRKQDINDFHSRIKRINSPKNKSYYDPDLGMHIPKRVPRDKIKKGKVQEEQSFLADFIVSAVLGAFGFFLAQIIRVRFFPGVDTPNMALAVDVFLAIWFVALITALAGKRKLFERISQVVGVYGMIAAGHNLIWRWPDQMAIVYGQDYVDRILAETTQLSLIVGANVYSF